MDTRPEERRQARSRPRRRGQATITVVSMLTLVGFAAMAVDLSYAWTADAHLGAVTDAAALAGAAELDGTAAGMEAAIDVAIRIGEQHRVFEHPVDLSPDDVVTGIWDKDSRTFTPSTDPVLVDAIRVLGTLPDLQAFFGGAAFGVDRLQARESAIALKPAPIPATATDCFVPLGLPACVGETYSDSEIQQMEFKLGSSNIDSIGWVRPGGDHPNTSWIRDQITDCEFDGAIEVGDPVTLDNGGKQDALRTMVDAVENSGNTWQGDLWGDQPAQMDGSDVAVSTYGRVYEGAILIFGDCNADGSVGSAADYCDEDGGGWTGEMCVHSIGWGAVYDGRHSGGMSDRTLKVHVDLEYEYLNGTKGDEDAVSNVLYQAPPSLVQ